MKNKGTGWIPDYPDINDYTLQSEGIQNLKNRIYSQNQTASIEGLASTLSVFLDILKKNNEVINSSGSNTQLDGIEANLKGLLSEKIDFEKVELHNVFQQRMSDSEIILIKNYLQRILRTWNLSNQSDKQIISDENLTDTMFDSKTSNILKLVIQTQKLLVHSNDLFGKDEMEAIKDLANLSIIATNNLPSFIDEFVERWKDYADEDQKGELLKEKYKFTDFHNAQVKLIIHLRKILDIIKDENLDYKYKNYEYENSNNLQESTKGLDQIQLKVQEIIEYLERNRTHIVTNTLWTTRGFYSILQKNANNEREFYNEKVFYEILYKYDPMITSKDYEWIDNTIKDLKTISAEINQLLKNSKPNSEKIETNLDTEASKIKDKIINKIYEWKNFINLVCKLFPPQLPPQSYDSQEILVPSPIPNVVRNLLNQKLLVTEYLNSKTEIKPQLKPVIESTIESTVELMAQVLMPLAKHVNLSRSIDRRINQVQSLFTQNQDDPEIETQKRTKKLVRETGEEYDLQAIRDYSLMDEMDFYKIISGVILQKIEAEDKKHREIKSNDIFKDKVVFTKYLEELLQDYLAKSKSQNSLYKLIVEKLSKCQEDELQKFIDFVKIRKPLYEIQRGKDGDSNNSATNPSEPIKNILQFPINLSSQLYKTIDINSQSKEKQKRVFLLLPEFVDLSYWCSPIEDQGTINSCTAHAGIALMEYAEKKSTGNYTDGSALFLYKATRNLMQREGDSGASVRDTMKAMVAFGVCPENYWSYDEAKFDEEPTPFCYSFAENYKTLKYFRLDHGRISRYALLSQVKLLLTGEFPCIFGFTLYKSVYDEANTTKGYIPLPNKNDRVIGGHTVVAVGYHDRKIVENADGEKFEGALLIRNSWGTRWGEGGYGWLPYDYIVRGLTADWWSLLKAEWLASGNFGAGASAWNADQGGTPGDIGDGQTRDTGNDKK